MELQSLDVAVNSCFKTAPKERFTGWCAERVQAAIRSHPDDVQAAIESVQPDLQLSLMKLLHARWITEAFDAMILFKMDRVNLRSQLPLLPLPNQISIHLTGEAEDEPVFSPNITICCNKI